MRRFFVPSKLELEWVCLQGKGLRRAAFVQIERTYMIGLRASRPETRAKFFQLYHDALPRALYDRLRFILEEQDWTHLSHTFWIKHGLVRPLAAMRSRTRTAKQRHCPS